MSYKEELDRIKEALDYALFGCSDDNANTEKHFNTLQNALIAVDRIKKSQSNLLDQKIDEEGNVIEKPENHQERWQEFLNMDLEKNMSEDERYWWNILQKYQNTPTLRQEREDSKQNLLTANRIINEQSEELKRLKEENEKLVNSVGEWSALAIDRKQDLDEANKKIEELKEGIDEILDLDHGHGVINQTWMFNHLKELKESLTK